MTEKQPKRWKLFLPLIGFVLVCGFLYQGLRMEPSKLPSALVGKPFPVFSLPSLKDDTQLLDRSAVIGEVALVNVWATWCPSCRVEHRFLNQIAEQFDMPIYGINYKDERAKALQWLQKLGDPYRVSIFDEEGNLGIDLGVYGAPETYLIDHEGMIRYKHVGVVDMDVWRDKLQPIVEELRSIAVVQNGDGVTRK
ncbi:MAG: DsbE family thiol:disulfide interchange protein [Pseudomonadales bacterium]|nr:DsbE family thiol:disulfide interchange protein [Pseudomonadales bacterium]